MVKKKNMVDGPTLNTQTENMLSSELFMNEHYLIRRNVLNGKVEFKTKNADDSSQQDNGEGYRTLTKEALNSMIISAKREQVNEKGSIKQEIIDYVHSEEIPSFNPIGDYLVKLPKWDGHNHVADLFSRIPGLSSEQLAFLAVWIRSAVAHWLQLDLLHGNECVPTLIGAQGCGKTTFLRRLLPPHLRQYYLDHLNLSNKFDKEMALTNNLIVNLDEFDAISPSQHPSLKQTLSKSRVNGRPIFGTSQDDRLRYASFVATTNNPHPLTDATGSRRYLCITIPKGQFIDNTGDINYDQLYAQVLYELNELHAPYWYNNEEVARIQALNQGYMQEKDVAEIVSLCFRKPNEGEHVKALNCKEMLSIIQEEYPMVKSTHSTKVHIGLAMKEQGYESYNHANLTYYYVVPQKSA